MDVGSHWENVWSSKREDEVSWFEPYPELSLGLVDEVLAGSSEACVLDVGGGASMLAEVLLHDRGLECLAVLDFSASALERSARRLGEDAGRIQWIHADITKVDTLVPFEVWHDRAVFHFLTDAEDRRAYVRLAAATIPQGGHAVMATFGPEGPTHCSGLPVERFGPERLAGEFGRGFELQTSFIAEHPKPMGGHQSFLYALLQRVAA